MIGDQAMIGENRNKDSYARQTFISVILISIFINRLAD
jgi:hypothetical protein